MPPGGQPVAVAILDKSSIVVATQALIGSSLYLYGEENSTASEQKQQGKLPLPCIKWENHKVHEKRAILNLSVATATYGTGDGSAIIASCSEGTLSDFCVCRLWK